MSEEKPVTTCNNPWIRLARFPSTMWNSSQLIKINHNEFARCSSNHISKYNINSNEWDEWIKYPQGLSINSTMNITAAFDQTKQILYIYCNTKMITINIKENNTTTITTKWDQGDDGDNARTTRVLIVNHKLNVIGGAMSNKHLIWNDVKQQFDEIFKFPTYESIEQFGLIHIKSENKLLTFGGFEGSLDDLDYIFSYDLEQMKWSKLPQRLPHPLSCFGCVVTKDEDYFIMFGGITSDDDLTSETEWDTIYILNIKTMKFIKSDIVCPSPDSFQAVIMSDTYNSEILVYGYIRYIWDSSEFSKIMYPPDDIIKLITCFYSREYIHLMSGYGHHWKIEVDEIIQH